ncbi:malonyl-ACP O-methyltransferase BioC [Morganella morganii]|uniref:malonyl-ACP O-methyltransferase BioC n=1 Tax=Morganella morganii TaxID=582 RepID=UPI0021CE6A98|nr:malonyl-ACP O-methyltransferase BioC [Morganella morganii]MCU6378289.1 malonyl-ACP O-methyltransferase BioC [Morganella morganii]
MHSAVTTAPVNKAAVAAAFGRAAGHYDTVAHLQQKTGHHLRQLTTQALSAPLLSELHGLDAGCGTGFFSEQWKIDCRSVTAFDLSPEMLAHARQQQRATRYVQGDIEQLPFADNQFDFCFSNLAVQWCDSLAEALAGLVRVTRPGGVVAFSTLLSGSLDELNQAFARVDSNRHANGFLSREAVSAACQPYRHTLSDVCYRLSFDSLPALLHSLKGIGATHVHQGRAAGLMTRNKLIQLANHYPAEDGAFPLSYLIQYGVIHVEK